MLEISQEFLNKGFGKSIKLVKKFNTLIEKAKRWEDKSRRGEKKSIDLLISMKKNVEKFGELHVLTY